MKTPIDKLIYAKEQQLRLCEQQQANLYNNIRKQHEKARIMMEQIATLPMPNAGSFALMIQANTRKNAILITCNEIHAHIARLQEQMSELEKHYRFLHKECEKLRHIRDMMRKEQLEWLKRQERKELDEIAIVLYKKERA